MVAAKANRMGRVSSKIIPPKPDEPLMPTSVRIPKSLLARLDEIAEETGYSRQEVLLYLIRWGVGEYDQERGAKKL